MKRQPSPEPASNLKRAAAALQKGDLATAERACRAALKQAPKHPGGLHLLGVIARSGGYLDDAVQLFEKAVAIAPQYGEAWVNLGRVLVDRGEPARAAAAFEKALATNPKLIPASLGLARVWHNLGKTDAAAELLRKAANMAPGSPEPHFQLANLLQEIGEYEGAIASYCACLERQPGHPAALSNRASAFLKNGQPAAALADAEAYSVTGRHSANVTAYRVLSLQMLERFAEAEALCDPSTMVFELELPFDHDFAQLLEHDIRAHPTLTTKWDHGLRAARGGAVTADLMSAPTPAIEELVAQIRWAVQEVSQSLPTSAGHPFLDAVPNEFNVTIWANILAPGGQQAAHIHNLGWASGVFYSSVPVGIDAASDEGWIVFGEPGYGLPRPSSARVRKIQPKAGRMLLFPSYMWHHTVPLNGSDERISIAFDIVSK